MDILYLKNYLNNTLEIKNMFHGCLFVEAIYLHDSNLFQGKHLCSHYQVKKQTFIAILEPYLGLHSNHHCHLFSPDKPSTSL